MVLLFFYPVGVIVSLISDVLIYTVFPGETLEVATLKDASRLRLFAPVRHVVVATKYAMANMM